MAIEMFCDRCEELVDPDINGGVRLKLGKREFAFHLCEDCQGLLRKEIGEVFLKVGEWREVGLGRTT